MPAKQQTVTILFKPDQEEAAKRVATILDGPEPRKMDDHFVVNVPLKNLEAALLFEEAA